MGDNFTIRDEIREYWSLRAKNFDADPGHGISGEAEKQAWLKMFSECLGEADDRKTLDLACGTGEISHLLHDFGLRVTGLDWSDAMLAIARAKSIKRNCNIRFLSGDAENTNEPNASYDLIVTRHLVWTLVDPDAAFKHWYELLKPGGVLLIIDGDFVTTTPLQRLLKKILAMSGARDHTHVNAQMNATHKKILNRVYFNKGAKAQIVINMLGKTGFSDVCEQAKLSKISKAQARHAGFLNGLARLSQNRYIIRARK